MPNAAERTFWYGVNFELSYNARHWEEARYAAEVRPILGWRFGPVDLILNPIVDLPFHGGPGALTFAPAERVAYNLSDRRVRTIDPETDPDPQLLTATATTGLARQISRLSIGVTSSSHGALRKRSHKR